MFDQAIVSTKIADSAVTSSKLAGGAVKPTVHIVKGNTISALPHNTGVTSVDCPAGEILTGGGYSAGTFMQVYINNPADGNTWSVVGWNDNSGYNMDLSAYALCTGPFP